MFCDKLLDVHPAFACAHCLATGDLYSVCLQQGYSSKLIALYWCCHEWSHYCINSEV